MVNQGQQNNSERTNFKPQNRLSRGDAKFFILRKTEKLTTALYMVTEIMPDKEPLKWKMRELGVELLSEIAVSLEVTGNEHKAILHGSVKRIEKIVTLIEIAETARVISEMNASVLKKEYLDLKSVIKSESEQSNEADMKLFSQHFFDVALNSSERSIERLERPIQPVSEKTVLKKEAIGEKRSEPEKIENKQIKSLAVSFQSPASEKKFAPQVHEVVRQEVEKMHSEEIDMPLERVVRDEGKGMERSDRRTIILALIKQKPALTVKIS